MAPYQEVVVAVMAIQEVGIDPEERRAERKKESNNNKTPKEDGESYYTSSNAKSRIEETKEKSPFVAEVIGDVCPEAEEDENKNGDVEVVEVVVSALEVVSDEENYYYLSFIYILIYYY